MHSSCFGTVGQWRLLGDIEAAYEIWWFGRSKCRRWDQLTRILGAFLLGLLTTLAVSVHASQECEGHLGAGVLPYTINQSGERFVLLGFQPGRGWSSFGGGPKYLETLRPAKRWCEHRKETALREGIEEMRLLVSRPVLDQLLQAAEFFPKKPLKRDFVTFVVKIKKVDTAP